MEIKIQRSMRKSISLQVKNSQIIVKAPLFVSKKWILEFVNKHKSWVEKKLAYQQKSLIEIDKIDEYKELAKKIIPMRVEQLASKYWCSYNSVKINSARRRWGSCTSKKNLNFTFRLVLTPPEIIDYVICHELAHLKEMNHSSAFWKEVEKMDIDYKKHDRWLKENGDLYVF